MFARRRRRFAGSTGRAPRVKTPAGDFDLETPLLGVRQSVERARRDSGGGATSRCRSTPSPTRVATLAPGAPPRRAAAPARWRHAHRRFVQLEPGGASARARDDGQRERQRAQDRGARRDARARRSRATLHEECGAAAAAAGLDLLVTIGGEPAHAMADAAIGAGMPAAAGHPRRDECGGGRAGARARSSRAISCW